MRCVRRGVASVVVALSMAGPAAAAGWVDAGDGRLRDDLQLLVDGGVLQLPAMTWPLPVDDLRRAVDGAPPQETLALAHSAALERLREVLRASGRDEFQEVLLRAGRPGRLRTFETPGREEGELQWRGAATAGVWAVDARVSGVTSPMDGQSARLDGSSVTLRLGNWAIAASLQERFWGPGHDGSLLFGNDARPIPALVIDRATSAAPQIRGLRWVGPWRLTTLVGRMDGSRDDVESPLFFGMRFTMRPLEWLEFGASRTAQFCGRGRECGFDTVVDMLAGRDNVGFGGIGSSEEQPGNQLAGFELRLRSPWRSVPLAVYGQDIGEDQIDLKPTDRMHLYGAEGWWMLAGGGVLRAHVEYADTVCAAGASSPFYDCAYSNVVYFADGYRFRGRPVGHTTDADSISRVAGLSFLQASGAQWRLRLRNATFNRGGAPDAYHSQAATPTDFESVEVGFRSDFRGGQLDLQFGFEKLSGGTRSERERAFGMVTWRRTID